MKYIKTASSYILKKHHQLIDGGTVYERDIVTIGGWERFIPGKRVYIKSGNFVFTVNSLANYQRRVASGEWSEFLKYSDVKDASAIVNTVAVNQMSRDIRDYAYYGSAAELVRVSLEHIVRDYPGYIMTKPGYPYYYYKSDSDSDSDMQQMDGTHIVANPFDVNLWRMIDAENVSNTLRHPVISYKSYCVDARVEQADEDADSSGATPVTPWITGAPVTSWEVEHAANWEDFFNCPQNFVNTENHQLSIKIKYKLTTGVLSVAFINAMANKRLAVVEGLTLLPANATADAKSSMVDLLKDTCIKGTDLTWPEDMRIAADTDANSLTVDTINAVVNNRLAVVEGLAVLPADATAAAKSSMVDLLKYTSIKDTSLTWPEDMCIADTAILTIYGYWNGDGFTFVHCDNNEVVPRWIIRPCDECFDEFFDSLAGFEAQLLTRATRPLYKATFLTPQTTDFGSLMGLEDYVYPSTIDGFLDIESSDYSYYVTRLTQMASAFDTGYCDNLYQRMTHEAIRNFDWTYTREFNTADKEVYVDGGTRMSQFLRLLARGFDDVKRLIDGIGYAGKVTYNRRNNMPEALLSDTLDGKGWDVYSVVPSDYISQNDRNTRLTSAFLNGTDNSTKHHGWRYVRNVGDKTINNGGRWEKSNSDGVPVYSAYNNWHCASSFSTITPNTTQLLFERELLLASAYLNGSKGTRAAIEMIFALFGFGEGDYKITEEYQTTKLLEVSAENEQALIDLNQSKSSDTYDEDDNLYGLPLEVQTLTTFDQNNNQWARSDKDYLVPYYTQGKVYDGYLYFQQSGGWGRQKASADTDVAFGHKETVNYTRAVDSVSDLSRFGCNDITDGEVVYVSDVTDFAQEAIATNKTDGTQNVTNYFQFHDGGSPTNTNIEYVTMLGVWKNLPSDDVRVDYISNLANYTRGNNPHAGYGRYDNGESYLVRLAHPFYYAISKARVNRGAVSDVYGALRGDSPSWDSWKDWRLFEFRVNQDDGASTSMDAKCKLYCDYVTQDGKAIHHGCNGLVNKYPINTKRLTIRVGPDTAEVPKYFQEYFEGAMLPYIMQVIPSTTILILDYGSNDTIAAATSEKKKYRLTVAPSSAITQTAYYKERNEVTASYQSSPSAAVSPQQLYFTLANNKSTQFSFDVTSDCAAFSLQADMVEVLQATDFVGTGLTWPSDMCIDADATVDALTIGDISDRVDKRLAVVEGLKILSASATNVQKSSMVALLKDTSIKGTDLTWPEDMCIAADANVNSLTVDDINAVANKRLAAVEELAALHDELIGLLQNAEIAGTNLTWPDSHCVRADIDVSSLSTSSVSSAINKRLAVVEKLKILSASATNVQKSDMVALLKDTSIKGTSLTWPEDMCIAATASTSKLTIAEINAVTNKRLATVEGLRLPTVKYVTPFAVDTSADWIKVRSFSQQRRIAVYVDTNTEVSDEANTRTGWITVTNAYSPAATMVIGIVQPDAMFDIWINQGGKKEKLDNCELSPAANGDDFTSAAETLISVSMTGDAITTPIIEVEEYVEEEYDEGKSIQAYIDFDQGLQFAWGESTVDANTQTTTRDLIIRALHSITPNSHYVITLTHPDNPGATCSIDAYIATPAAMFSVRTADQASGAMRASAAYAVSRGNILAFTNQGEPTTTGCIEVSTNKDWYFKVDDDGRDWVEAVRTFTGLSITVRRNEGPYRECALTIGLSDDPSYMATYTVIQEEAANFALTAEARTTDSVVYDESSSTAYVAWGAQEVAINVNVTNGYRQCAIPEDWVRPEWVSNVSSTILRDDGTVRQYIFRLTLAANEGDDARALDITFAHGNDQCVSQTISISQDYQADSELRVCVLEDDRLLEVDYSENITAEQSLFYIDAYPQDSRLAVRTWSSWIDPQIISRDGRQYLQVKLSPNSYMVPRSGELKIWNVDRPFYSKILKFWQNGITG